MPSEALVDVRPSPVQDEGVPSTRAAVLGGAGAAAFLLLALLGALAVGVDSVPSSNAPAPEIARFFTEHRQGHILNLSLATLGAFFFYPAFVATLYSTLRYAETEGGTFATLALMGGLGLLPPLLVQAAAWGAAAAPNEIDPAGASALLHLGNSAFTIVPFPIALIMGASSIVGLRTAVLPRWLSVSGAFFAVVFVLAGVAVPGLLGAPIFFLFGLWMILVSGLLIRGSRVRSRSGSSD